ncbi:2-amino-4-hydroxy-6-hydroxymethyldihydropteridine diphosphokinase [Antarcticibacterium flavum]|uniref:2-amino-4-hydroxy-6-hydroxymethyldihydropteridine pyrophosphokinase n=1 Tax=Antarcticibacterium flavum TaxID=2058175 RepID=A0A5B7X5B8_9FLAO|nr:MULTISPECIES: 2-amino-4-hydroxy-6-hydroxymethyldihydropteridine diphosphokinase [Antarcticibacterium]MCM4158539.1 2-amino-4-hydroxy-6-hydroxymethyldihydropteridine diphosphokinase [Antarcticibacterium sp. W02-3]QCY70285.1 2-amino-4-hydroxy-6-hydroxymethyldihydropteridine diphosphokinase [Antarcticibacterium flavum]
MNPPKTFYIALGSNKGNRLELMQRALDDIYRKIGEIGGISFVYETPAWGFKGDAFLNACVEVKSRFPAEVVLEKLLFIENMLGRVRAATGSYENRSIDLDIILAEEEVISSTSLRIPHPEMQKRKFVLLPLADIAGKEIHPVQKLSVNALLANTTDDSPIEKIGDKLVNPQINYGFQQRNYIAIEGNIGAGKTSLSTMISQDFNAKLILERFKDNPFLPKFYEDQNRYAFPLEMSFLADRYQQLSDDLAQYDLFADFVVSDYDVFKSLIFAKITLQEDEYALYDKLFRIMYKELVKPDLYIYLYQNTERLLENIKTRGRDYEQNIQPEYLVEINKSYLAYIKSQTNVNVRIIDISGKDFVNNREDYLDILEEMESR